ncbi:MAG TPA: DUF5106 domain-containing protein [Flavobacteriales bacterium]
MRNHVVALLLFATAAQAQDKRVLEFHITGAGKDTIHLANFYGNKLYYTDTAVADAKGKVVFNRPAGYKSGVYAVVVPGPKYFQFLVNEPKVVMTTDTTDINGHLQVTDSKENKVFLDYVVFVNGKHKEAEEIRQSLESTTDLIGKAAKRERLTALDKEVKDYQLALVNNNPGTFAASIVRMSIAPDQVEIKKADGTLDSAATYYHYRAHFWDNVDLRDERNLRTPVFQNKFDEYIGKVVPQIPDTIGKCADDLIRRMDDGGDLFKFAVNAITYKYENSDIMGMDAVFVHMAKTYYCPPEKTRATWMPADKLEKLCERARKMAPIVIGAPAQNIILPDTTEENWVNMNALPNEYVLAIFWDPHCGHCKKTLPGIHTEFQEKLKPLGVEVFAVAKATDSTLFNDWKKFIRENKLDWKNVGLTWHLYEDAKKASYKYIPKYTTIQSLNYADAWDVYSTPKFFLLDKERKIVGKQLSVDQMVDLIGALRKKQQKAAQ